jgi:uncharacterized protein (DUF952 family)
MPDGVDVAGHRDRRRRYHQQHVRAQRKKEGSVGFILHITQRTAWNDARAKGYYAAPSLATDGFIHCSTVRQALDTANAFFLGQPDLVLLCIDESRTSVPVKYEPPTGGAAHDPSGGSLFPHLYGPLNLDAVIKVVDFPFAADGTFKMPPAVGP